MCNIVVSSELNEHVACFYHNLKASDLQTFSLGIIYLTPIEFYDPFTDGSGPVIELIRGVIITVKVDLWQSISAPYLEAIGSVDRISYMVELFIQIGFLTHVQKLPCFFVCGVATRARTI